LCTGLHGIKDEKDVIYITEVVYNHVFFLAMDVVCEASMYCKKISDMVLDDGAPIASMSFWKLCYLCWLSNSVL
jgi:hypothetical protein